MILWLLAVVFVACAAMAGYRQGAIRAAFSLIGLLLAALLALPLSGIIKLVLSIFGVQHPVALAFLAPAIMYVLIVAVFKSAGFAAHKKVESYYKYKVSETQWQLWDRLNQRLALCLGAVNGVIYFFLLAVVVYLLGYTTVQVATSDKDSAGLRTVNALGRDLQSTHMTKAIAPFVPASPLYFDAADILGIIYHNPLVQGRLSRYPVFVTLAERPEFQTVANDTKFQELWASPHTLSDFINHEKMKPLIQSVDVYTNVMTWIGGDLKDLKEYLLTGKSAKYEDEKILGRWDFDYRETMAMARKRPNMTTVELTRIRRALGATMTKATFTATIDHRVILKARGGASQGSWKNEDGKYTLGLVEGGKTLEASALVETNRMVLTKDGLALVFEK